MKLYYSPGSCSLAPHIVLEELKLNRAKAYETVLVSAMDGSTKSHEYLGINPKARVPALDIGGQILTEAPAIICYLALMNPQANLLDTTPIQTARAMEWMNWLSSGIHALAIAQNWRVERFSDNQDSYKGIREKGMINLVESYDFVEEKLKHAKTNWANGNQYCIVDPYLLVFYRWGNRLNLDMRHKYPVWTDHAHAMLQRQAVINVLAVEDIEIWN